MPHPTAPYIIPVLSGKGGVGKSSVTVQLALSLTLAGHTVGVLDIDLTGPSIPRLFGIEGAKVTQAPGGWLPVQVHPAFTSTDLSNGRNPSTESNTTTSTSIGALYCMSLGFLLRSRGDAVIWRGPKKTAMVAQLLSDVLWPEDVEYLLVDTPPGTSDEHISLMTSLLDPSKFPLAAATASSAATATLPNGNGEGDVATGTETRKKQVMAAVVVTTPQAISTADVKKELTFCRKVGLRVLGVVENMAGFVCPCCGEATNVFSKGGGQVMAREWQVRFLGSVPIDGDGWGMLVEEGRRPRYGAPAANGEAANVETDIPDSRTDDTGDNARMVEKYMSCSLAPLFAGIVEQLAENEGTIPQQPVLQTG